jgi:tetratricopeptide (TPR) repeat protein
MITFKLYQYRNSCQQALLAAAILITTFTPAGLHADQSVTTPAGHGTPGDYENRLEKLRSSYHLFPLNEKFKHDLAEAYSSYGGMLLRQRQYEQADENFIKAIELYPDEAAFAFPRGICNYYLKKYDIARYELERTLPLMPASADVLYYLGLVLYETDYREQAIKLWEQALILAPGRHEITAVLEKARRETAVETGMDRGHSSRFNLTYDPGVDTTFALAILDVLENASNQVGAELGHFPGARVPVAIYKRDDYKNVTNSPDWSGGVYDGTIRLPFGSLGQITPPIRSILFHEYAHVVVFDLTRGNCPVWLNEGIAEMFGRQQFDPSIPGHGQAARKGTFIDIRRLEGGFSGLSASEATLAYQQSYSMVNYIVQTYGWHRAKAMLTALGAGMKIDRAIASALQDYSVSYDGLIKEWRDTQLREATGN